MSDGTFKILVTGGRDYDKWEKVDTVLETALNTFAQSGLRLVIIEGGARGADQLAREWAQRKGVECITVAADWWGQGKKAGVLRNQKMIDEHKPDAVVAFPGGKGTADMVKRAHKAKLRILDLREVENDNGVAN